MPSMCVAQALGRPHACCESTAGWRVLSRGATWLRVTPGMRCTSPGKMPLTSTQNRVMSSGGGVCWGGVPGSSGGSHAGSACAQLCQLGRALDLRHSHCHSRSRSRSRPSLARRCCQECRLRHEGRRLHRCRLDCHMSCSNRLHPAQTADASLFASAG